MSQERKIVLLVDDDHEILDAMKDLLRVSLPNVDVLAAPDGPSALSLVEEHRPAVIVSDYRMPVMDGIEFLRRTLDSAPDAARLMVSSFADQTIAERAVREADLAMLVTKPFQLEYFVRLVGSLLEQHAS